MAVAVVHGGWLGFLTQGVLVVVHPDLEHMALDARLVAELLHRRLVLLLDPPPNPLREHQHLVLLVLRELGPEPLPVAPRTRCPHPAARRIPSSAPAASHHRVGHVVLVVPAVPSPPSAAGRRRQRERQQPVLLPSRRRDWHGRHVGVVRRLVMV